MTRPPPALPSVTARCLPALLGVGLAACVVDDPPALGHDDLASQCGGAWDVQNVERYDGTLGASAAFVARHQARVGYHVRPGCTGTLISDDLFLSAGHCGYVVGDLVRFNYQNAPDGSARPTRDFAVTAIVEQELSASWDYAIVRLASSPGRTYGHAQIAAVDPPAGSTVVIIQHPAGVPKVVHAGPVLDYASPEGSNWFRYQVDTTGGSSGSAVLDLNGEVVGVHTDAGCNTTGAINGNSGMRMTQLVPHSATLQALSRSKILWRNASGGQASIWTVEPSGAQRSDAVHSVGAEWTPLSMSDNHVLWRRTDGRISYWRINDAGGQVSYVEHGPFAGWTAIGHANDRILWRRDDGAASIWSVDASGAFLTDKVHGPFAGWTPIAYANNKLLWRATDGGISLWHVDDAGNLLRWVSYAVPASWAFVGLSNNELTWRLPDGSISEWLINPLSDVINTIGYGPYAPFQPVAAADRKIIWRQPSGLISYWTVNSDGGHMRYAEHGPFGPWMATLTAGGRP